MIDMNHARGLLILLIFATTVAATSLAGAEAPPSTGPAVHPLDAVIADLGAEDPALRRAATERITDLGVEARDALRQAVDSPDPAVTHAAKALLASLPWHTAADSPEVRNHLQTYAATPVELRSRLLHRLGQLGDTPAGIALLRILQEEPATLLRWQVVQITADHPGLLPIDNVPDLKDSTNTPLMIAVGWERRVTDRAGAIGLIRRAIEIESRQPTDDQIALIPASNWLLGSSLSDSRFDRAVDDCRLLIARDAALNPGLVSFSLRFLLNLHTRFSDQLPAGSFDHDLARFATRLKTSGDWMLLAQAIRANHCPWTADTLDRIAHLSNANRPEYRYATAAVMMDHFHYDLARREMLALLNETPAGAPGSEANLYRVTAFATLALMDGQEGRDALAATHWQQALPLLRDFRNIQFPGQVVGGDATVHAREQLLWRQLRLAQQAADNAAADQLVDQLVNYGTADADILHDLIPALESRNRQADADRLFDAAYSLTKIALDQRPNHPEPLNNLAWLCARSGRKLDDARALSKRAVELDPDNAAYLDTLAEIHFRQNNPAEAVILEQKALRLRPGDPFMQRQLKRYQGD